MTDVARVQQLLDELIDSQSTPEEVCGSWPELLPEVRARWRRMCLVRAELDALFPTPPEPGAPEVAPVGLALPKVPGYEVEAVLGRGGMGVVFRARQLRLGRVVALKMMLADVYAGPHERTRFQREAEAVAALQHPNVVPVYDVGDAAGRPYFTMECVAGGTLAQRLAGPPLPARDAAALLAALAEGVQSAHAYGIVHRDLKPANVLLAGPVPGAEEASAWGTPKISDFGLARRLDGAPGLTRTGAALGMPSYMAPEQAEGAASAAGPGVDIYALGAILYELLTGQPPFRAETVAETLHQVRSQHPVPPSRLNPKLPRDLETICLKCLRKEPHLRYASAAALADDLHRFRDGEAILARPEGAFVRLARRARRRPVLSAALALCAVILLSGGLWIAAERATVERAAQDDLREMSEWQEASAWPEACAALQRAKGRLGSGGSPTLRRRLDQGTRDLDLVAQLDTIRLNRVDKIGSALPFMQANEQADAAYAERFRTAGFGDTRDAAEAVACPGVQRS